jgi:hypothetical protein
MTIIAALDLLGLRIIYLFESATKEKEKEKEAVTKTRQRHLNLWEA